MSKNTETESPFIVTKWKLTNAKVLTQRLILKIRAIREYHQISQSNVHGFSQNRVSAIERATDLNVSTLIRYVNGMGYRVDFNILPLQKKDEDPKGSKVVVRRLVE